MPGFRISMKRRNRLGYKIKEMSHTKFLNAEIFFGIFRRLEFDRNAFDDLEAAFTHRLYLDRVV